MYAMQINVSLGKENVFFCNPDGLRCLDKRTGKTVWIGNADMTSNAEVATNQVFAASGNTIYQFEADTGKILNQKQYPDEETYRFLTFVGRNKIVASTYYGTRKLVNMHTGKIEWEDASQISNLRDKPIVSGKNLLISGNMFSDNKLLIVDSETGKTNKVINTPLGTQFDVSDGKILLSDKCIDSETLEPLWFTHHGYTRSFDCFDTVCFWEYDNYTILDWSGNQVSAKNPEFYQNINIYYDSCILKPATSNGRFFLLTERGFLVGYGNKPESISFSAGNNFITANGEKIILENKPYTNDKGEIFVDPIGFLEPLGWVSSHNSTADKNSVYFHNYKKEIELFDSSVSKRQRSKIKRIACQTNNDVIVMPLDQMVTEFGLTMTKDGDRIKLSYQIK